MVFHSPSSPMTGMGKGDEKISTLAVLRALRALFVSLEVGDYEMHSHAFPCLLDGEADWLRPVAVHLLNHA